MRGNDTDHQYDLTGMIARPLYFGMIVNVLLPAALLLVCYYLSGKYFMANHVSGMANVVFYAFVVIALSQAGLALWWRNQSFSLPMVRRAETFEADIASELLSRSKPIFLLVASMSGWGFAYFFLTGRFQETVGFVVLSFLVFQVIRPRYRSVEKLIDFQQKLVEGGSFMSDGPGQI